MLDLNLFVNFIIIFMIENVIDKLNKLNDSIKAKVDD